ncbi:MAG: hypothetical protein MUE69_24270 [Myxococcota bacterium]|jgi:hypothetical protein|nr:hypothetical protein [Myxococcota bacterium]
MRFHAPIHAELAVPLAELDARRHDDTWRFEHPLGPAFVTLVSRRPSGARGTRVPTRELELVVELRAREVEDLLDRVFAGEARHYPDQRTCRLVVSERPWRVANVEDAQQLAPKAARAWSERGRPWIDAIVSLEDVERLVRESGSTISRWFRLYVLAARRGVLDELREEHRAELRRLPKFSRDDFDRLVAALVARAPDAGC